MNKIINACLLGMVLYSCGVAKYNTDKLIDTALDLKNHRGVLHSTIETKGFYRVNDEGGAFYKIRDVGIPNGVTIFKTKNGFYAHLNRNKNDEINVKQLGAVGDGRKSDRKCFEIAVDYASKIYIPKGEYRIAASIFLKDDLTMYGEDGAVFKGGLIINGSENILIKGITFLNWNINVNNAVRITKEACTNLKIENCSFKGGVTIYQQLPRVKTAKNISILNCDFECQLNLPFKRTVTIQLHSDDVFIEQCKFDVSNIDSCIKIGGGNGEIKVYKCDFFGDVIEEIFDFYTFKGNVEFDNNLVKTSAGGIIRSKPGRLYNLNRSPYSCVVSNNIIEYSGKTQHLIYLSGSYLLVNDRMGAQSVSIFNNEISCTQTNYAINIRGMDNVLIEHNKILAKANPNRVFALNFAAIKSLEVRYNELANGGILGFQGKTPGGSSYKSDLSQSKWIFKSNLLYGYTDAQYILSIVKIQNLELVLIDNTIVDNYSRGGVVNFANSTFRSIDISKNKITSKKLKPNIIEQKNVRIFNKKMNNNLYSESAIAK